MKRKCHVLGVAFSCTLALAIVTSCGGHEFWATPIASVAVTPPSPSLLAGTQQQFTAYGTFQDGSHKVVTKAVWTTSNAAIVYINASGVATAVAVGSATISASLEGVAGSTTVSVISSPLNSIEIAPMNPSVHTSQGSQQFSATGFFSDGTVRDISSGVSWTSSDTTVATVSTTGLATLVGKVGTTTITATSGNISNSTMLTVLP